MKKRLGSLSLPPQDLGLALLIVVLWGSNNVVLKYITDAVPPLFAGGVRFALQALCLLPFLRCTREELPKLLLLGALTGPLYFFLIYTGFAAAGQVSDVIVFFFMWVPLATLLAIPLIGERPTAVGWLGLALSMLGIAVLGASPNILASPLGVTLVGIGALLWALATVLARKLGGVRAVPLQAWSAVLAAPPMLLASHALEPGALAAASGWWIPLIALSLYSALCAGTGGNGLMFVLVRRHPVDKVTPYLLLTLPYTVATGVIFLGDTLTPRMIAGMLITLAGLVAVTLQGQFRRKPPAAPTNA